LSQKAGWRIGARLGEFQKVDPTNPKDCDALDLRPVWRASYESSGPAWDAALEMGIDMNQLMYNLSLTPTERLMQLDSMAKTFAQVHGSALPKHP
jgi:hypothetical protein